MSDYELFDKLVREIEAAEAELARIQAASGKGAGGGVKAEAAELKEEEAILRAEPLSGLVEDEQSRYYIAVGCIEKQLEDLRQRSSLNVKAEANCAQDLDKIRFTQMFSSMPYQNYSSCRDEIAKQKKIVSNLETELGQTNTKDDVNSGKRKEFQMQSRHNSMVLKSLKGELRDFLNDRAKLNPNYQEDQGSCFGYLLQVEFQTKIHTKVYNYGEGLC